MKKLIEYIKEQLKIQEICMPVMEIATIKHSIKLGNEDWLFDWCETPGDFIDNLDACVYWYNRKSFEGKTIKDYFKDRELKILPKYRKYLDEED